MRNSFNRRTATKVRGGKTQRKNRNVPTTRRGYVIDRRPPGRGRCHVLTKRDLQRFIDLIPDWVALSDRLERIELAGPCSGADAFHEFFHREETGAIYLASWEKNLWQELPPSYYAAHRNVFERLGVAREESATGVMCRFTMPQARAFLLLHIFMHELGHHWDRLNQKHRDSKRGEDYAESFANRYFDQLYPAYVSAFGDPAIGD